MQSDRYVLNWAAETRAMVAADAVVTLSETMRGEIIERGCRPEDVVVVPNAVDVERFAPRPRDAELADRWGIAATDPVIGYISTFSAYEGIRYLVEATALLRDRGRHVKLLLVGDGDQRDDLVARVHDLGLDDGTVVMPGRVPHGDVVRYHSLIDVFVVPRTGDRVARLVTPLKPYEAMAMERAVVVSDVPALREIVVPGETGLVFRPEDAHDLADVLRGGHRRRATTASSGARRARGCRVADVGPERAALSRAVRAPRRRLGGSAGAGRGRLAWPPTNRRPGAGPGAPSSHGRRSC